MQSDTAVLFLSTLGILYQWPHLKTTAGRLLKWVFLTMFLTMFLTNTLTITCSTLAEIEPLRNVSPLYAAASAGDRFRTTELVLELMKYDTVAALLKAGADPNAPGPGPLGTTTPLA